MHEYSVVAELVEALTERLADVPGTVTQVHLRKGELRILSDRALVNAYEVVTQGTRLSGSTLEIETIPARVSCKACSFEGAATVLQDETFHFAIPVLSCPQCGSDVDVLTGRELTVESVSVEGEDEGAAGGA